MRGHRGILAASIVGALATAIVTAGASATASPGAAVAAKKCKKRHSAKTKEKCTKKKRRRTDAPNSPVLRATVSWSNLAASDSDVEVDLYVFDGNDNRAGNGSNTIPLSSLSGDVTGRSGSETFADSLFAPQAARDLSFGVCYFANGPVPMNLTITYVTADGVIHGDSQSPVRSAHFDYPGGAPIPDNYCNFV